MKVTWIKNILGSWCMRMLFIMRRCTPSLAFIKLGLRIFRDPIEVACFKRKGQVVIWDLGASLGKYTAVLAELNPSSLVLAFEPNLNSLYYLGMVVDRLENVTLVPCALTADGLSIRGTHNPDFNASPTGPFTHSISVQDAIACYGRPEFIKMDIEGAEYDILGRCASLLADSTILVSWHGSFERRETIALTAWNVQNLAMDLSLLIPRNKG